MILMIIQARMTSTRLPGKVMKKVLGKPLIDLLLERVSQVKSIDKIVVAIPASEKNDELFKHLQSLKALCIRGSENDVLDRFFQTAQLFHPQAIVRVTADCPLIDPDITEKVVQFYKNNKFDYVSNINPRTYPDGLDVEIFSFDALKKAWQKASRPEDREHVTPYIIKSEEFSRGNVSHTHDLSQERWTLDTESDLQLISFVFESIYLKKNLFIMNDILDLKKKHPEVFRINLTNKAG